MDPQWLNGIWADPAIIFTVKKGIEGNIIVDWPGKSLFQEMKSMYSVTLNTLHIAYLCHHWITCWHIKTYFARRVSTLPWVLSTEYRPCVVKLTGKNTLGSKKIYRRIILSYVWITFAILSAMQIFFEKIRSKTHIISTIGSPMQTRS